MNRAESKRANKLPDPEYVASRVGYDPESGDLWWMDYPEGGARWANQCAGKPAFKCNGPKGYLIGNLDGYTISAHRVAWAIYYGKWPDGQIDHIDGNKGNNGIANLRDVSPRENCRNLPIGWNNKSGVTGVYLVKSSGKWCACITIDRKSRRIGMFASKEEAAAARKQAERSIGFHPNHGRPR